MSSSLKGDVGVLSVTSMLAEAGLTVLRPVCEAVPFDLVVYHEGSFHRIQVKRGQSYKGTRRWIIPFRKTNPNAKGYTEYFYGKDHTDILCGMIPETGDVYFFPIEIERPKYEIQVDPDGTVEKSSHNKVLDPEAYRNVLRLGDSIFQFPRRGPTATFKCVECRTRIDVRVVSSDPNGYYPDHPPDGWTFSERTLNARCPKCNGRQTC